MLWVHIRSTFLSKKIICAYLLEVLHQGTSNECTQHNVFMEKYLIQPIYPMCPYKRTVKQIHRLWITVSVLFVYFFIKAYVVGTHLNCIDLSLTTYAFIKKIRKTKPLKTILKASIGKSFADRFFKCILSIYGYIFYHKFSQYFEKT